MTAWACASVVKTAVPPGAWPGAVEMGNLVDIEAIVLGEHLGKVDLDAHREQGARGGECPGLHIGEGCS